MLDFVDHTAKDILRNLCVCF